ncbi:MAG: sn-glycerol-3-phosphate ABC transporter ATP-binding protein UgpC [Fusicatenibacter sp.]|nr:sn-glycerol-3-phosphate ABC transporter ATP-binding protein UgpC [Fusicatenibacter sp.]
MSDLALKHVCKTFDHEHYAVKDFTLDIPDQEFVIFVGPSGCGKSTTLRMIAGLEEIGSGELWIGDELCNYVEPKDRDLSMVFQNYALYPNMTVYENLAFSLKVRKVSKEEIDRKVHETAKLLDIEHLLDRRPKALSGGQKQRVAIGSAIMRKPKAFLMDEPLSNLDAKLRAQMRVELSRLHKELKTTMIYVTHDQTEAMTLGTRIVVMKEGLIQQADTPERIYSYPVNRFVAGFIGSPAMNFFAGMVSEENGSIYIDFDQHFHLRVTGENEKVLKENYRGKMVTFGIRPEDLYEEKAAKERKICKEEYKMEALVEVREMLGAEAILHLKRASGSFAARISSEAPLKAKEMAILYADMEKAHFFDCFTEENILCKQNQEQKRNEE